MFKTNRLMLLGKYVTFILGIALNTHVLCGQNAVFLYDKSKTDTHLPTRGKKLTQLRYAYRCQRM
jgi:hypothetical protein